jgi:hypothetical protein
MIAVIQILFGIFILYKIATYEEPKNETPEQRRKRNADKIW